jgi:hypothetical protein
MIARWRSSHRYFGADCRTRSFQSVSNGSNGPATRSTKTSSNGTSAGSNHSANASFAFATASSSVSPALAHPGSSGKTADQRCTSGSNSMTRRSFTTHEDSGVQLGSHSNNLCPPDSVFWPPIRQRTDSPRRTSGFRPLSSRSSILNPLSSLIFLSPTPPFAILNPPSSLISRHPRRSSHWEAFNSDPLHDEVRRERRLEDRQNNKDNTYQWFNPRVKILEEQGHNPTDLHKAIDRG